MADPSKPSAGLVQTPHAQGKGNTVYMWGGVINPFNACSRLTGCAADDTPKVARAENAAPAASAAQSSLSIRYEEMVAITNSPDVSMQDKAAMLLARKFDTDKLAAAYGLKGPEQQQIDRLARDTSNKFLDTQYQAVTGALRLGAGQNEAILHSPQLNAEAVSSVQAIAMQMHDLGLQDVETSYSRFGTTGEAVNSLVDRLSEANVIDGFGNRVEQTPVNKGQSGGSKLGSPT